MSGRDQGIKGQIAEAERIAFEQAAPLSLPQLRELLSSLNIQTQCDHTFSGVQAFAEHQRLDVTPLLAWLAEHGAHCDCEVVYNVYDQFGDLLGWHLS